MRKFVTLTVLGIMLGGAFGVSGCGIKPSELSPPSGDGSDHFPHTYPNPKTNQKDGS